MELDEALIISQIYNDLVETEEEIFRPRRRFLRHEDAFQLSDRAFVKIFRLNKTSARDLIDVVSPLLDPPTRRSALEKEIKVLAALHFYGNGAYQGVGKNIFSGISQPSVSRSITEVTKALNMEEIRQRYIKFPHNYNELQQLRTRFYQKHKFPGVVGCIDCTHVAIVAPSQDEHIYVNRKQYHSLNVQLVCDENLKIMNVNPRYPGSSHDSFIWRQSNVSTVMENIYRIYNEPFFFLGDSGYPLRPWLQTVITDPTPGPEARMNKHLKAVRSIIERCNGVLKNRFRCLLRHRVLHYTPEKAANIVVACAILHNICIDYDVPQPEFEEDINIDFGMYEPEVPIENSVMARVNPDLVAGRHIQQQIVRKYFNIEN